MKWVRFPEGILVGFFTPTIPSIMSEVTRILCAIEHGDSHSE